MQIITGLAVVAALVLVLIAIYLLQVSIAPRLLTGILSEPVPMQCNVSSQWVLYDCKPNPITGLGCIVPGSNGKFISGKTLAVNLSSCLPRADGTIPGSRVISFAWAENGNPQNCVSPVTLVTSSPACCNYNSKCTQQVEYICKPTGAAPGGENQCLPSFLPIPYPEFSPLVDYTVIPAILQIPCRQNYCKALLPPT